MSSIELGLLLGWRCPSERGALPPLLGQAVAALQAAVAVLQAVAEAAAGLLGRGSGRRRSWCWTWM